MRSLRRTWLWRCCSSALFLLACGSCLAASSCIGVDSDSEVPVVQVDFPESGELAGSDADGSASPQGASPTQGLLSSLEGAQNAPFAIFRLLDGFSDYESSSLPKGFAEEVLDPSGVACTACYCAEGVVGMLCKGESEGVLADAAAALEERGWLAVDGGGGVDGLTFSKDEGRYRWVYLACSQVSGSSSLWVVYLTDER